MTIIEMYLLVYHLCFPALMRILIMVIGERVRIIGQNRKIRSRPRMFSGTIGSLQVGNSDPMAGHFEFSFEPTTSFVWLILNRTF